MPASLFQVDSVALIMLDPTKKEYYVDQAIGLSDEYIAQIRIPAGSALAKRVIKAASPLEFYDVTDAPFTGRPTSSPRRGQIDAAIAHILRRRIRRRSGPLLQNPRHFVYSELRFSQSLAEQAGIAFANANLHTNLQKASNEIEQTRNLMRDGLLVFDLDQRLRYFNAAAGALLKLTPDAIMKKFPSGNLGAAAGLTVTGDALKTAIAGASTAASAASASRSRAAPTPLYFEAVYSPYRDTKAHARRRPHEHPRHHLALPRKRKTANHPKQHLRRPHHDRRSRRHHRMQRRMAPPLRPRPQDPIGKQFFKP
jgi:PAS domain-containing protein